MELKPISIIGGGLAGLTLGILLRRANIPVTLSDAGEYPRHRVCGEFLSGRGQNILTALGLADELRAAHMESASTVGFFVGERGPLRTNLPKPGWAICRYDLDALLARKFQEAGGHLLTNRRESLTGSPEGTVHACGNGNRSKAVATDAWRYVGIKIHARNLPLVSDLEMHSRREGYFGLCKLADGVVNVCALLRSRTRFPQLATNWREFLMTIAASDLRTRLAKADFIEDSFCATAGMRYQATDCLSAPDELRIGDAYGLIAPFSGNGMSMAIESAPLTTPALIAYAHHEIGWQQAASQATAALRKAFELRIRCARIVQSILFAPPPVPQLALTFAHFKPAWNLAFALTRA